MGPDLTLYARTGLVVELWPCLFHSSARGEVYLGLRIVIEGALARANARETPWRGIFFAGAGQHSGKRVLPLDELALGVIATQKHHLPVLTKKEFRS